VLCCVVLCCVVLCLYVILTDSSNLPDVSEIHPYPWILPHARDKTSAGFVKKESKSDVNRQKGVKKRRKSSKRSQKESKRSQKESKREINLMSH